MMRFGRRKMGGVPLNGEHMKHAGVEQIFVSF
jgi:hypothetical protein